MSTITEFAIFPIDKGQSVSNFVSKVIEYVRDSGYKYQLTSMGTIFETETFDESLAVINKSYLILSEYSDRIYCTAKFDSQKGKSGRLQTKIESIENKIGRVSK